MDVKINKRHIKEETTRKMILEGIKQCSVCKEVLPLSAFTRNLRQNTCGYKSLCKKCINNRASLKRKHYYIKHAYGKSEDWYNNLVKEQNGKCAICKKESKLVIDHCHLTNKVRELLCNNCNTGLGYCKEDVNILKNMIEYINKHNEH